MGTNPNQLKSCSPRCWFAKRDKCTCICHGKNHKISEEASSKDLEKMEAAYQEYKKARKEERRAFRKGVSVKSTSGSFMRDIIKIGKQVKG